MAKAMVSGRKPKLALVAPAQQMSLLRLRIETTLTLQDIADRTLWSLRTIHDISRGARVEQDYHRVAFFHVYEWAIANGYAVKEVA